MPLILTEFCLWLKSLRSESEAENIPNPITVVSYTSHLLHSSLWAV